jgi:MoaA/NifB/PqqE/SkfB family radical SAM enzyme
MAVEISRSRSTWPRLKRTISLEAAGMALQVPLLRDVFLDRMFDRLSVGYDETVEDKQWLGHVRWFAEHLRPFLHRLIGERPAAAKAILRFIGSWTEDIYRRTATQNDGRVSPCTVVIEPTDRCNLHCPGCYAKSSSQGHDLPYEKLEQIVRQTIDMGVTLVTISGGEPFMREREDRSITRLARTFRNRGFLVYTNGTMIDEPIARRLGQAPNVFPAISVEGFEHQTDARRGSGIYAQNRRAREYLARHGVMTGFSATLTRENVESICTDGFIDLRIEEGDLFGWFFLLQPIGRSPRPDLMVTADQRAMLRETINRWRAEKRPIFLGDFWNDGHLVEGCIAAGRYYFHIYANGDISPCVFSPVSCGNIFDIIQGRSQYESLDDLVQRNPVFRAFRDEQDQVTDRARPCMLIDHPEAFRRVARMHGCKAARNMGADYLEGPTAEIIDEISRQWRWKVPYLSPLPSDAAAAASELHHCV